MENDKKNKIITYSITGAAFIIILVILVIAKKQELATTAAANQQEQAAAAAANPPVSLCYLLNTPTSSGNELAYLQITTSDGGQTITGELGVPAGKTESTGPITGSITNDNGVAVLDAQYTATVSGKTTTAEQTIDLNESEADVDNLKLPAVDCSQYNTLKAAALK